MSWNPEQYLKFADHRLRPAVDLMARIDLAAPVSAYDLGCGAGNVTRLLRERWPKAGIIGVDSSPEMLDKARRTLADAKWMLGDLAAWQPSHPADLLFSNAALQWLGGHPELFARLYAALAPGGVLAVQMPRNFDAPSHAGMAEAALAGPWRERLAPLIREAPVHSPEQYWGLLADLGAQPDVWEVTYLQALGGEDAVVQWTLGTALRPLLAALDEPERGAFLADYRVRMAKAYPRRSDGVTLFPFRRLFIVAKKPP